MKNDKNKVLFGNLIYFLFLKIENNFIFLAIESRVFLFLFSLIFLSIVKIIMRMIKINKVLLNNH